VSLSEERTPCPHCGLNTRTAADGVCVECWNDKSARPVYAPGKRPTPPPPRPQGGGYWLDPLDVIDPFLDPIGCLFPLLSVVAAGVLVWWLV
jgi:hypothetical protein